MPSIQQLVQKKLNKRTSTHRKSMASQKRRSVVVLRPSMRTTHRGGSRRASISRGLGGIRGSLGGIKRTLDPYATALGMGTIFVGGASKVKPDLSMQQAQMVGLVGEYVGGGVKGVLGAEVVKALLGVPSIFTSFNLGGLLGGGGQQQMQMQSGGSALL